MKLKRNIEIIQKEVEKMREKLLEAEKSLDIKEERYHKRTSKWQESDNGKKLWSDINEDQEEIDGINACIECIEEAIIEILKEPRTI